LARRNGQSWAVLERIEDDCLPIGISQLQTPERALSQIATNKH
jgi:hypothetical protein